MQESIPLSSLLQEIENSVRNRFGDSAYWISCRVMNVKKQERVRRCYLDLEEYSGRIKVAEAKAVFWSNYYNEIEAFEEKIKQPFADGTEIVCLVKVKFHKIYGLKLEVIKIDVAHTLGVLELERQETLAALVKNNPDSIIAVDGIYHTLNNRLPLPPVIQRIALITAPNSDGQRDFIQELTLNKHGYYFEVIQFLATIQGANALPAILEQLDLIERDKTGYHAVAIVRGGGSLSDFKVFEEYVLAERIANFPIPVFTGIGHDRNQSICDLMAREFKTPTRVATWFTEHNFAFENELIDLKERIKEAIKAQLEEAADSLKEIKRIVKLSSPEVILKRGFALIMQGDKIITNPASITEGQEMQVVLKDQAILTKVLKKQKR